MTALSNYEKVSRVVSDGSFISRVKASVSARSIELGRQFPDHSAFLVPVANTLTDVFAPSITGETDEDISAQTPVAVATITDEQIDSAVEAVYAAVTGYVAPATGQAALADLAADPRFQARVYQIIAAKANGVLAQPALEAGDAGYEADRIKRGFAMRLQAGLYLTPQFKQNFAINVLGAIGSVEAVTDQSLSTTIDTLLGLFVSTRLELIASTKTLENVLS